MEWGQINMKQFDPYVLIKRKIEPAKVKATYTDLTTKKTYSCIYYSSGLLKGELIFYKVGMYYRLAAVQQILDEAMIVLSLDEFLDPVEFIAIRFIDIVSKKVKVVALSEKVWIQKMEHRKKLIDYLLDEYVV
jgi:hypothetical protein